MRLRELARQLGAELVGDGDVVVSHVASLASAQASSITFLSNARQRSALAATGASAVILERTAAALTDLPKLIVDNAYAAYARAALLLHPPAAVVPGVHASAVVASSATVAASAAIGPFVTIGERSTIGERASIGAGAVVGDDCVIGDDTIMQPRVALYART